MDFVPEVGNLNAFVLFGCVLLLHFSAAYFPEKLLSGNKIPKFKTAHLTSKH
jgi:hypothetical protein